MTDFQKIEREIKWLEASIGYPQALEIAQSMRLLLGVARAAEPYENSSYCSPKLAQALTALREHCS